MADAWDQFPDAPAADPWAQFPDAPQKTVAGGRGAYQGGKQAPPVSPLADFVMSLGSGAVRGATETAMLPVTAKRLLDAGGDAIFDAGDSLVRRIIGAEPLTPEQIAARRDQFHNGTMAGKLDQAIYGAQDSARATRDSYLHEPQTTAGEYARTIGEFAVPGSLPSKATRAAPTVAAKVGGYVADTLGNTVLPAIASETAGQATKGSDYEWLARIMGGVGGQLATSAGRAWNAPEMATRRYFPSMSDEQWAKVEALVNNPTGIKLSVPEAVDHVMGGATAAPNLLRIVEGSGEGRVATAPFFAARPGQVDAAVGNVMDKISPQDAAPSTLGARASAAGQAVIDQERRAINDQTRPLYKAAEPQTIPPAEFAPIAADPRFKAALDRLRNNPELAPDYAALPDNSVALIDAVTKDMAARGEALANKANPLYGPELAAKSAEGAASARDIARAAVPEYDTALAQQAQMRNERLMPLTEGPVGRIAAAGDTAKAADAILPRNPLTGSAGEQGDAVARMAMQDPATTKALVRQNLGDRYTKAATETQAGDREFAGASFHKDVAGNATRKDVLDAVMNALPGAPTSEMATLLDVLAATQRRQRIGSATAFNAAALNNDLGAASPAAAIFGLVRSLGTNVVTRAGDATKRAALRGNLATLADMFTGPDALALTRAAMQKGVHINLGEALPRTLGQTLPMTQENQ